MVTYSVAVCNYEMAETLEPSLRSILDQVGDEYEVVVVDGGSGDDSVERLEALAAEDDRLRVVALDPDPERRLGADRQRAVEEARGDYVLVQLDVDDVYDDVIEDFVTLYHQFESGIDDEFFLSGDGLNMAPKTLLEAVPYRNLASSEDRDLWRRLLARDALVWLDHQQPFTEIGYEKSPRDALRRDFSGKVADAQVGISLGSALRWALTESPTEHEVLEATRSGVGLVTKRLFDVVTLPLAHAVALHRESFETPAPYDRRGELDRAIERASMTAREVARAHDVNLDCAALSEIGRDVFGCDPSEGPSA